MVTSRRGHSVTLCCLQLAIVSSTQLLWSERYGRRGFSVTAPRLWNDLPDGLRLIDSLELFKSNLKTHLFNAAFVNEL